MAGLEVLFERGFATLVTSALDVETIEVRAVGIAVESFADDHAAHQSMTCGGQMEVGVRDLTIADLKNLGALLDGTS